MQNLWLSPSLIVIVLLVVGGLLLQTQRLGDASTQLEGAQVEIEALKVTATTINEQLRAEATQAAATQSALEASAATQQAQAATTQTAQAASAATQQAQAAATQTALAAEAATQQAQAEATQVAFAAALDESETNADALTQDLATQAYAATRAAEAAQAQQAALQATATLQAEAIETISQDYADLEATATLVAEQQATLAVDTMATMVALGYREDGSDVPVAVVDVEDFVYEESFENNRNQVWFEGDFPEGGAAVIRDGVYEFSHVTRAPMLWTRDLMSTQTDQLIETRFRMIDCSGDNNASGIEIVFFDDMTSAFSLSIWCVHNSWSINRYDDGEIITLDYGRFSTTDPFFEDWHTFAVLISANSATAYFDNLQLGESAIPASAMNGETYLRVLSDDPLVTEIDSIRVWNTVPTATTNTGVLSPVVSPTSVPFDGEEVEALFAQVEAFASQIPDEIIIDGEQWVVDRNDIEFQDTDGDIGLGAYQLMFLSNDEGDVVLLTVVAYANPDDAGTVIREIIQSLTSPYSHQILDELPSPNYFGLTSSGMLMGGWIEDSIQVGFAFLSPNGRSNRQFIDLARWLNETIAR